MKKVLIIGKRGFIGRHLYKYLKIKFYVKNISFKNLNKFKNNLDNYDFIITENKISKKFKNNSLILRPSNIIGDTEKSKRIHCTFIDIFQKNIQKGFVYNNGTAFKDFLSIDKFCQILQEMINKKLTGTYNISIGQKVYLNDLIKWLNKYNTRKYKIITNLNLKNESFYLNNKKIMSKIKIKNSLNELKKFCYNYSKKKFINV